MKHYNLAILALFMCCVILAGISIKNAKFIEANCAAHPTDHICKAIQ